MKLAVTHAAPGVIAHKSKHATLNKKKKNKHAAKLEEYLLYSHFIPLAIIVFHVLQKAKEIELLIYKNYCITFLQDLSPTTTKCHMSRSLNDIALVILFLCRLNLSFLFCMTLQAFLRFKN